MLRALLVELSFGTSLVFRQDYVDTDRYFMLPEDSTIRFDFRFDTDRPFARDDYVHMWVMGGDGSLVFDQTRPLDQATRDENRYLLAFTELKNDGPFDRWYYENLELELLLGDGWVNEEGEFVPMLSNQSGLRVS